VCEDTFENFNYQEICLGTIRIPFIKRFIHLTNDSVHCIDDRPFDAKAVLAM
jgi:hypothetical protein